MPEKMPTTMSSSRSVKPRTLSAPCSPEAELQIAETGESEGWPVNPRGKARDIAHAHGALCLAVFYRWPNLRIDATEVRSVQGRDVLSVAGALVPVVELSDVLGIGGRDAAPARGAISVTERTGYIGRVRALARQCAERYIEERTAMGHPLIERCAEATSSGRGRK